MNEQQYEVNIDLETFTYFGFTPNNSHFYLSDVVKCQTVNLDKLSI